MVKTTYTKKEYCDASAKTKSEFSKTKSEIDSKVSEITDLKKKVEELEKLEKKQNSNCRAWLRVDSSVPMDYNGGKRKTKRSKRRLRKSKSKSRKSRK